MNTCVYHGNCVDGTMSALVCTLAYPGIDLYSAKSRTEPPPAHLIDGKDVVIADFSYPLDVMKDMHARAKSLILLDHHKSAQKALGHLPYCVFDLSKSGAQICWDFFFPGHKPPVLLNATGEADLGKCELPHTREIMTLGEILPFKLEAWMDFMFRLENDLDSELRHAAAIAEWRSAKIDRLLERQFLTQIGEHIVPAINSCDFKSELGRRMAIGNPFAVVFSGSEGCWYISLRSAKDGLDVAEIAESFGGGGHRNAAAFISDRAPINLEDQEK